MAPAGGIRAPQGTCSSLFIAVAHEHAYTVLQTCSTNAAGNHWGSLVMTCSQFCIILYSNEFWKNKILSFILV